METFNRKQELTPEEAAMILGMSSNNVRYHQRESGWPRPVTLGFALDILDDEAERAAKQRDRGYAMAERLFGENEQ